MVCAGQCLLGTLRAHEVMTLATVRQAVARRSPATLAAAVYTALMFEGSVCKTLQSWGLLPTYTTFTVEQVDCKHARQAR